jgi:hypothetical protein
MVGVELTPQLSVTWRVFRGARITRARTRKGGLPETTRQQLVR